jgi:hypothetical protein
MTGTRLTIARVDAHISTRSRFVDKFVAADLRG